MNSDINTMQLFNAAEKIITETSMPPEIKKAMLDTLIDKFSYNSYSPEHMRSLFMNEYSLFKTIYQQQNMRLDCLETKGKNNNVSPAIFFLFCEQPQYPVRIKQLFPEHFSLLDIVKELNEKYSVSLKGKMKIPDHKDFNNNTTITDNTTLLEYVIGSYRKYPIELIDYLNQQNLPFKGERYSISMITRDLSEYIRKNKNGDNINIEKTLAVFDIFNQRGINPNITNFYELDESIQKKIIQDNPAFDHKILTKNIVNGAINNSGFEYVISIIDKLDPDQFISMFPGLPERKQKKFIEAKTELERKILENSIEPKKYSNKIKDRI